MGVSTTHAILSMWILIYSFDTYYVWAACGLLGVLVKHVQENFFRPLKCVNLLKFSLQWYKSTRRTVQFAGELLPMRSGKQPDRFWPLIGHKKRTSIRICRGTGSLIVLSPGLSHPFLKNFAPFFPIQLTTPKSPNWLRLFKWKKFHS